MSAECEKHGVDLHGDTFSGLICPVCEVERERDELAARLNPLDSWLTAQIQNAAVRTERAYEGGNDDLAAKERGRDNAFREVIQYLDERAG